MKIKKQRVFFIDFFKCLAMIFVIILHIYVPKNFELKYGYPFTISLCIPIFMICTGFNLSLSDDKSLDKMRTLKEHLIVRLKKKSLLGRFKRILLPFLPLFTIFLIWLFKKQDFTSMRELLYYLLYSGWGPGSYYIPALIQIYFLWPFLYYFSRNHFRETFSFVLIFAVLFEILVNKEIFPEIYYRYYIHRQLPFVVLGILMKKWYVIGILDLKVLYRQYRSKVIGLIILFSAGLVFIVANQYLAIGPVVFVNWAATSVPTFMYIFPLMMLLAAMMNKIDIENFFGYRMIVAISRASFHIYLIQMFYYLTPYAQTGANFLVLMIKNLIICISLGYLYYKMESAFKKALSKK